MDVALDITLNGTLANCTDLLALLDAANKAGRSDVVDAKSAAPIVLNYMNMLDDIMVRTSVCTECCAFITFYAD